MIIGAVLGGVLQVLRDISIPPGRTAPDIRSLRDALGADRFNACVAEGTRMSYDELVEWLLATLDRLADSASA